MEAGDMIGALATYESVSRWWGHCTGQTSSFSNMHGLQFI